ncbi:alpha/beta fold hydrolase [Mycolicibacterium brisbanense]|uniref:Carboxylesterase n=1 Tax=Mycolicibacterium brisbanense TaxID=146020 RepID=A0A117I6B0_9MYCO|nr:alpha/beta hydrolase [Mycolicibacterium brisbanense]MCV7160086.1 alpha/beta fold hydrolase [Mycolicibacterium brisbanense]GAS89734.1 carboxylesterase [Mycolicibacterium brisbanense]
MDLAVPEVNFTARWARGGLGGFIDDAAFDDYLRAYRAGMAKLPDCEISDVSTTFGTVRAYRFAGPDDGTPVVLLPGRNAATPMYRTNLTSLRAHRTIYGIDLLGEAGLSVQRKELRTPGDQARWLDDALAGLGLSRAHLLGVSIGGWTATNCAVHQPDRIASLTLLDPVFTFARIPVKTMLAAVLMYAPGMPETLRRRVLSWISGGADIEAAAETELISAGSRDFALRTPMPTLFTDAQLRSLAAPVLALIAGRSVMHNPDRAAARARHLLPHGQVEVWAQASHAINGEYPDEIAQRARRFWDEADASS